jgi:hypothetical protein
LFSEFWRHARNQSPFEDFGAALPGHEAVGRLTQKAGALYECGSVFGRIEVSIHIRPTAVRTDCSTQTAVAVAQTPYRHHPNVGSRLRCRGRGFEKIHSGGRRIIGLGTAAARNAHEHRGSIRCCFCHKAAALHYSIGVRYTSGLLAQMTLARMGITMTEAPRPDRK